MSFEASAIRSTPAARAPRQRSAVTNGRKLFVQGDGNSAWSRRYRDLIAGHVADLGGMSALSEAQLSLVKRASAIECELEQQEGKLSQGEEIDLDEFTRAASHLRRILETVGLGRVARDITPSLHEYLAAKATQARQDSSAAPEGAETASDASKHATAVPIEDGA